MSKTLTNQLRELEEQKIIKRIVYAEIPPKVEYSLTEIGESIIPVLKMLCEWGKKYQQLKKMSDIYHSFIAYIVASSICSQSSFERLSFLASIVRNIKKLVYSKTFQELNYFIFYFFNTK